MKEDIHILQILPYDKSFFDKKDKNKKEGKKQAEKHLFRSLVPPMCPSEFFCSIKPLAKMVIKTVNTNGINLSS